MEWAGLRNIKPPLKSPVSTFARLLGSARPPKSPKAQPDNGLQLSISPSRTTGRGQGSVPNRQGTGGYDTREQTRVPPAGRNGRRYGTVPHGTSNRAKERARQGFRFCFEGKCGSVVPRQGLTHVKCHVATLQTFGVMEMLSGRRSVCLRQGIIDAMNTCLRRFRIVIKQPDRRSCWPPVKMLPSQAKTVLCKTRRRWIYAPWKQDI